MFYPINIKSVFSLAVILFLITIFYSTQASAQDDTTKLIEGDLVNQGYLKIYSIKFLEDPIIIKKESYSIIDSIAVILLKNPRIRVEVSSYAETKAGKEEKTIVENEIQKAKAICNHLAYKGVTETRFTCKGYVIDKSSGTESIKNDTLNTEEIITDQDTTNTNNNIQSDSANVISQIKPIKILPADRPRIEFRIISR